MFNSTKISQLLVVAVAFLCSCSQTDDIAVGGSNETLKEGNIVFRLQSNSSNTTRSAEDSYEHVQGTVDEYKVNVARVYFFDNVTKHFAKSVPLTNITRKGSDADGNVIYETDPISIAQGVYDIFVTANTYRQIKTDTEEQFLADIDSVTYAQTLIEDISGGIVMSNRAADNEATIITETPNENDVNVVNIKLERVLARLDIAKSLETYELTDPNGVKYASVKLNGYYIVNLPKYYYTFRHVAVLLSLTEPQWNIQANFGNVADVNGYVIDPYFFKKTINASGFTNADQYYVNYFGDIIKKVRWNTFNPASQTPNYKTAYSLENCCLAPAQKNGYSTGVIFKAVMEPANNVYYLNNTGTLQLLTDKENYPEVLYYYQYKFYNSADALAVALTASGAAASSSKAQKFEKTDEGYCCYYNYWIRHLDNNRPTQMGVMEFAIVRNNLYRMLISNVSDLGDGTIPVDPDTPDEGETRLKVELNVKPWIVRDLTEIVL